MTSPVSRQRGCCTCVWRLEYSPISSPSRNPCPSQRATKGERSNCLIKRNEKLKRTRMEVTLVLGVFLHLLLLQCASCDEEGREDSGPSMWCVGFLLRRRVEVATMICPRSSLTPPPPPSSLQVLDTGPSKICDFPSQPPPHHAGLPESCVSGQRQQGGSRRSVSLTLTCCRILTCCCYNLIIECTFAN